MEREHCWCGERRLEPFSPDYWLCPTCGTLVLREWPDEPLMEVSDQGELYSKDYYLKRLPEQYGYPDLLSRARSDLSERVLHWLNVLLRYRLPPADVLELGSGHGGFVAMMAEAGYHAQGLELSPWLVAWSQDLFRISVLQGPLERQHLSPHSLDVVVLMDVLEHLPDPEGTIRQAASLLRPQGFFLIQTPDFREEYRYQDLLAQQHPFLQQFKPDQHLFLFSRRAVRLLFERVGFSWMHFEPAIFAHYDMFFVAAREPLVSHPPEAISEALERTRAGRVVEALMDLWFRYQASERDRGARGQQIAQLTAMVRERDAQIERLASALRERDAQIDRLASLMQHYQQQAALLAMALQQSRLFRLMRRLGRWEGIERVLETLAAEPTPFWEGKDAHSR